MAKGPQKTVAINHVEDIARAWDGSQFFLTIPDVPVVDNRAGRGNFHGEPRAS